MVISLSLLLNARISVNLLEFPLIVILQLLSLLVIIIAAGGVLMLGDKIKQLRLELNLTQEELAKKVGITTASIGMYETNSRKPSYDVLKKIANYFKVSHDYLLEEDHTQIDEPEVRAIQRAAKNMTPQDRKKMLKIIQATFEDAFSEDD
jgi:transcriptional regulator with XRE-family HTH domain